MIFDGYAPESKVWIFVVSKELDSSQSNELSDSLSQFVSQWQAHGKQLEADFNLNGRRLIICVNAASEPASGCSIDKLYTLLSGFSSRHRLDFMDRMWLLTENGLCLHAQKDAQDLSKLKGHKIVDLSINQLSTWKSNGYISAESSWIAGKIN